jgi:NADH dehydrogenase
LVLATGADTNFFNNENLIRHTYPMKSTVEALQLRHKLIEVFEACTEATIEAEKDRLLTMVVVGGGPTGVEVSGTLAEMKTHILPRDYPEIDFTRMRILLLEGGERVLSAMSTDSSKQAKQYLEELGVEVHLNTLLKDYDGRQATLGNGQQIATATVVWAAGIKGNVPKGIDPALVVRGNRIRVNRFNQVEGHHHVFALGDLAYMETPSYPNGHPQVANVAINQAVVLAKNLLEIAKGKAPKLEFEYYDKGSMATVGRHKAVVDIPKPKLHFGGFFAWFIWMGLHLMLILGVKNRIQVFVNWVYKYFTYDQSLRLLFRGVDRRRE